MSALLTTTVLLIISYLLGIRVQTGNTCRNAYNNEYLNAPDYLYPVTAGLWSVILEIIILVTVLLNWLGMDYMNKKLKKLSNGTDYSTVASIILGIVPIVLFLIAYYYLLYALSLSLYDVIKSEQWFGVIVCFLCITFGNIMVAVISLKAKSTIKNFLLENE